MYSYTYDKGTGGLLLNSSPTKFSKEPRPVYAPELDVLGFDKYWKYDGQTDAPYMWAEANRYWYRGRLVAALRGGNVYTAPEIQLVFVCSDFRETPNGKISADPKYKLDTLKAFEKLLPGISAYFGQTTESYENVVLDSPNKCPSFTDSKGNVFTLSEPEPKGCKLRPVDLTAMVEANREMLQIIEQSTVKKILAIYEKHKDRLDCFHVAFSGGKDSCVLLDLVRKTLPKGSFAVVFGDTGMEFPDTYTVIEKTREWCAREEIPFHIAKSHLDPKESWALFGPPSRTLRWCCGVHKSVPQTLKLREITGKDDYTGLAFIGVRAQESATRAEYDYFNDGKKIKGQYSHNSMLEWTSAEVWLYIYANGIQINEAYKNGNSRVGCIFCPMSVKKADYIKQKIYTTELEMYIKLIKRFSGRNFDNDSYIADGGWVSRRSGRDLIGNIMNYSEKLKDGVLTITVTTPKTDWREWIKTLMDFGNTPFFIKENVNGYMVELPESYIKGNPVFGKLFKQVFRKSAYCVRCGVCQSNCSFGHLTFYDGLKITDCEHCLRCHDIENGCHAYNSLRVPTEEKAMSINCFDSVLPKSEWFTRFFREEDAFWQNHRLGPNQVKTFKRFLKDAGLTEKNVFSPLARLIADLGWETETAWGIMLINLVTGNPQIQWYVTNLELGRNYSRNAAISMLSERNSSKNVVKFVCNAFGKLAELPLGTRLKWGFVTDGGDLVRTKCSVTDPRVVLYGLFKFAEKCNDYKEFTLATLLNDGIDRDGVSPTRIFGLDREDITPMLIGLSAKYPDFIVASFTHDLEKITLADHKTSADVLELFKEDSANAQ
jgi:phosphoadenosine phosphosulfate reductase